MNQLEQDIYDLAMCKIAGVVNDFVKNIPKKSHDIAMALYPGTVSGRNGILRYYDLGKHPDGPNIMGSVFTPGISQFFNGKLPGTEPVNNLYKSLQGYKGLLNNITTF